jgi:hypothetical protein
MPSLTTTNLRVPEVVLLDRSSHSNMQKQQQPHQIMAASILGKRQRSNVEAEGEFVLIFYVITYG